MKKYIAPLLLSFLFSACGNHQHDMMESEGDHHHESSDTTNAGAIQLNNGEKWQVNNEMKPYVTDAEKILDAYIVAQDTGYHSLAAQLKEKNSGLMSSCTMQGESHEQLHKWLLPNLKLVEALGVAADKASADTLVHRIQKSYQTYHNCFQ